MDIRHKSKPLYLYVIKSKWSKSPTVMNHIIEFLFARFRQRVKPPESINLQTGKKIWQIQKRN